MPPCREHTQTHTHRWIHSCAHADTHRSGWCGCLASQKLIESRSITVLISILVSVVNNNLRGPRKTEMLIKKAEGRFQYSVALCACFVFDPSSYCTRLQQSTFFVFVFKIIFSINLEKKLHTVLYWWTWDNTAHLKLEGLFSKCHTFEAMSILKATWCEHWTEFVTKVAFSSIFVLTLEVYAPYINERDAEMCLEKKKINETSNVWQM